MDFRHDERIRRLSRHAYQVLEPLHVIAYFSPPVREVDDELGMSFSPAYVGMRAAPLGACSPAVVSAAFFNFNPTVVEDGWREARSRYSPEQLLDAREKIAHRALTAALGERLGDPALPRLVARLDELLSRAPQGGRPLGAANLDLDRSLEPHVALWQAATTVREWRGDGHIAALVAHELTPTQAVVFHEADRPADVPGHQMGRARAQKSRAWNAAQWADAVEELRSRGLLEPDAERLSARGVELYQRIEDLTDDVSARIWARVDDAEDVLAAATPFVHAVIDAGILPPAYRK